MANTVFDVQKSAMTKVLAARCVNLEISAETLRLSLLALHNWTAEDMGSMTVALAANLLVDCAESVQRWSKVTKAA